MQGRAHGNGLKRQTDNKFLNMYEVDAVRRDGVHFPYYVATRREPGDLMYETGRLRADGVVIYQVYRRDPEKLVILRHGLKNAMLPVITYAGPMIATLLTGSFVIESLYSIPGIGAEFVTSITNRDYTMIMALTILYGAFIIIANIITDIANAMIDPRIKLGR